MAEKEFEVVYRINVYAEDPEGAALRAAEILSEDGAPARGYYEVTDMETKVTADIDLGEDEF